MGALHCQYATNHENKPALLPAFYHSLLYCPVLDGEFIPAAFADLEHHQQPAKRFLPHHAGIDSTKGCGEMGREIAVVYRWKYVAIPEVAMTISMRPHWQLDSFGEVLIVCADNHK